MPSAISNSFSDKTTDFLSLRGRIVRREGPTGNCQFAQWQTHRAVFPSGEAFDVAMISRNMVGPVLIPDRVDRCYIMFTVAPLDKRELLSTSPVTLSPLLIASFSRSGNPYH